MTFITALNTKELKLLHYGKIIQGHFKVLCIKALEIDTGFYIHTFNPMIVYNAHRSGKTILIEIPETKVPKISETDTTETIFEGYARLALYKPKNKDMKIFKEYFRML